MSLAEGAGLARLRERVASIPAHVAAWDDACVALPRLDVSTLRSVTTTGVGSSGEHAHLLAALLGELGVPARVAAPSAFLRPPPTGARDELLVVFSQGLAPNARAALRAAPAYRAALLATAVGPDDADADRAGALAAFDAAGGVRLALPVERESGLLVRVVGPMLGQLAAIALARALARALGAPAPWPALPGPALAAALRAASLRARSLCAERPGDPLAGAPALLAGGVHAARCSHLSRKLLEGLLVPWPPVWDLLDFAHGGFQQLYAGPATILALARADAPEEQPLFARAASMLEPSRHRWLALEAALPGPLALLEHEVMANELLLAALEARGGDPARWPGQDRDAPLYAIEGPLPHAADPAASPRHPAAPPSSPTGAEPVRGERRGERPGEREVYAAAGCAPCRETPARGRALEGLTWPELDRLLAGGVRTAVLALGSTEQHGPHLPYATDTRIAEALAARFCARVPEAVALPALALGCADEHLGFPGTLSLRGSTLAAVLDDVAASLARAGFERAFVFTAHGGNAALLADVAPRLGAGTALDVVTFVDHAALAAALFAEAERAGVAAPAAGYHAGEIETSILLALAPGDVRRAEAAAGLLDARADPRAIFYPNLRANAPSGVVGDPSAADAGRAARYLDVWVELLVACYERGKKRAHTKGTKKA